MSSSNHSVPRLVQKSMSKLLLISKSLENDSMNIEGFEDHYGFELQEIIEIQQAILRTHLDTVVPVKGGLD
ncbi:hypothetical protein Xen7305DRAFT_00008310 [Xenococcus sp. PCC 7305]|nr:hypothetical protein Xen7305DRAFT_00008310 [Xenococcus sp. PCC 7305]